MASLKADKPVGSQQLFGQAKKEPTVKAPAGKAAPKKTEPAKARPAPKKKVITTDRLTQLIIENIHTTYQEL